MTRASALVACVIAVIGPGRSLAAQEREQPAVTLEYGFRYDPMEFVEESDTLQGALVRRHVFGNPKPGDEEVLAQRVEQILDAQHEDGLLGERGHEHAALLMELADCGADRARPEVARAIEATLQGWDEKNGEVWIREIRALCMFGVTDPHQVKASLQANLDREEEWNGPWKLCPWGQAFYLRALWPAREIIDTTDVCARTLTWMAEGLNDAGCISFKDPWGLVWAAGIIDLPEAKRLVELQVPNILRGQEPDGGWGDGPYDQWSKNSLKVFQALVNQGLFDTLRNLAPLPPDWKIVREIPAPDGDLFTMTFDGQRLWALDRRANEAVAISPEDGRVLARLKIPFDNAGGVGWWDDGLGVTQRDPKRLVKLDPQTGAVTREIGLAEPEWTEVYDFAFVNGEPWVSDGFNGLVMRVDPEGLEGPRLLGLAGPEPISIAAADDGVWHIDAFAPSIIKSDFQGKLLEWGEKPFDGRCDGLAWDGTQLWALDARGKRVCVIERRQETDAKAADAGRSETEMADTQARFPEVLLEGVVADFRRITGDLKAHQVVVGDTVYPQPCVYLTTHLVEMWAAGWRDADFDTLAAVSGASALFAYEPREFMPKYANLSIGMDQRIASATGFGYEWVPFEGVEGAWAVVRASVDSGLPLKGWHWENLLIGGYRDAATEEDRRIFVMSDGPGTSAEWWTWQEFGEWVREWSHGQLGRYTRRVRKAAARKVALRVIRDLAEWSEKPPRACREGHPKATFGLAGIEAYAADCADTDAYGDWAACHDINPQWTIRNSTAVYLERVAAAGTFGRKVGALLCAAAEHYRASFACWEEFYAQLGHQAPENAGKMRDRRAAGAAAARKWLEHERAALAELRDALSLLEG